MKLQCVTDDWLQMRVTHRLPPRTFALQQFVPFILFFFSQWSIETCSTSAIDEIHVILSFYFPDVQNFCNLMDVGHCALGHPEAQRK